MRRSSLLVVLVTLCSLALMGANGKLTNLKSYTLGAFIFNRLGLLEKVSLATKNPDIEATFKVFNTSVHKGIKDGFTLEWYVTRLKTFNESVNRDDPKFQTKLINADEDWPGWLVSVTKYDARFAWPLVEHFLEYTIADYDDDTMTEKFADLQASMPELLAENDWQNMQQLLGTFWNYAINNAEGFTDSYIAFVEKDLDAFLQSVSKYIISMPTPVDKSNNKQSGVTTAPTTSPPPATSIEAAPVPSSAIMTASSRLVVLTAAAVAISVTLL